MLPASLTEMDSLVFPLPLNDFSYGRITASSPTLTSPAGPRYSFIAEISAIETSYVDYYTASCLSLNNSWRSLISRIDLWE